MARAPRKQAQSTRSNSADSTPLVDPLTYTDGVGFEPGNAAKSDKFMTAEGEIVDDLKGEPGWQVVVKGDRVTPEMARQLRDGGPDRTGKAAAEQNAATVEAGLRPRQSPELVDAEADAKGEV